MIGFNKGIVTKDSFIMVKYRQKRNQIEALKVDDRWIEGVAEVKEEVRIHFSLQFKEEVFIRSLLDGIEFKRISDDELDYLSAPFSMEEVEEAVWSFEGNKRP